MRISDWSSTCALPIYAHPKPRRDARHRLVQREPPQQVAEQQQRTEHGGDPPGSLALLLDPQPELGQPQCRRPSQDKEIAARSEEHTSELQSLMRISYAVFCLKKKKKTTS